MAALLQPSMFTLRRDCFLSRQKRTVARLGPHDGDRLTEHSDTPQVNFIHTYGLRGGAPQDPAQYTTLNPSEGLGGKNSKRKTQREEPLSRNTERESPSGDMRSTERTDLLVVLTTRIKLLEEAIDVYELATRSPYIAPRSRLRCRQHDTWCFMSRYGR